MVQLLRAYEAHIRFFNIEEEEEIFNLLAIRDELLKMELSEKECSGRFGRNFYQLIIRQLLSALQPPDL